VSECWLRWRRLRRKEALSLAVVVLVGLVPPSTPTTLPTHLPSTHIATYEILSEPRDKNVSASDHNAFEVAGCGATQAPSVDPSTPCMVAAATSFDESVILPSNKNVLNTFDCFTTTIIAIRVWQQ
jgi:hypothetical protein